MKLSCCILFGQHCCRHSNLHRGTPVNTRLNLPRRCCQSWLLCPYCYASNVSCSALNCGDASAIFSEYRCGQHCRQKGILMGLLLRTWLVFMLRAPAYAVRAYS